MGATRRAATGCGRVGATALGVAAAIVSACLAALAALAPAGCSGIPGDGERTLRIGVAPGYPPIVFHADDALVGVEPELARMAASELGREPVFVELDRSELIASLERGEIDVVMSGMSITPERAARVAFTQPYLRVGQLALIRRADLARLGQPGAIRRSGVRVGYVADTTGEAFVRRALPRVESYAFDDPAAAVRSLRARRIDVVVHDAPTIWNVTMGPHGDELIGLFRPLTDESLAWAVAPGDTELRRRLDALLDDWRADDRLEPVLNRWIPVRVQVGS